MTSNQRAQQLEDRLIDFAVCIIKISEQFPKSFCGQHFYKQIVRSGSAPALLYGEARGAESSKDFRHKMSIALKELRETLINLKIIRRANLLTTTQLEKAINENNELISIFVAAIRSVNKRLKSEKT